jgi:hypothetical protein
VTNCNIVVKDQILNVLYQNCMGVKMKGDAFYEVDIMRIADKFIYFYVFV